jgi:hypothetical protein
VKKAEDDNFHPSAFILHPFRKEVLACEKTDCSPWFDFAFDAGSLRWFNAGSGQYA